MPTLAISSNFSEDDKVILTKAFKTQCKYLGLESVECRFFIDKRDIGPIKMEGRMAYIGEIDLVDIEVNSKGYKLGIAVSTIGHEMTHARQHLKGQMKDGPHGSTLWKGKFYPNRNGLGFMSYLNLPWEREAHGNQRKVFLAVLNSLSPQEKDRVLADLTPAYWDRLDQAASLLNG